MVRLPHNPGISIHAPREGSDRSVTHLFGPEIGISIHAPREGSDPRVPAVGVLFGAYFYPRSPRGERHKATQAAAEKRDFYPRSPRGERPQRAREVARAQNISIHAPREGSDAFPA